MLKALALGARAVLLGRPALWGLAVGGQRGLEDILRLYEDGLRADMLCLGARSVDQLSHASFYWPKPTVRHLLWADDDEYG